MPNTMTLISSATVGAGGAASIDFTSIPNTYTDLIVKVSARTNRGVFYDGLSFTINNSTTNFTYKELYGSGTSVGTQGGADPAFGQATGDGSTANTFGNAEAYFPNYGSSNYKLYSADSVNETNATSAWSSLDAGLWSNTAAITSIKIRPNVGTLLVQYSTAYLYGIKNS